MNTGIVLLAGGVEYSFSDQHEIRLAAQTQPMSVSPTRTSRAVTAG